MESHDGQPRPDPWAVLGVEQSATDEQVRAAYIEQVKLHPPDRDQEQFERIRDAYDELRDPHRRAERLLFAADPYQELPSLLDARPPQRRHVGTGPWLAVLRKN